MWFSLIILFVLALLCFVFSHFGSSMLDYTLKSTTNYSKLLTLLIRVGGVFRHLAITSSWLEPVLFDIILTSSSSLHSPPLEKDVVLNMNG